MTETQGRECHAISRLESEAIELVKIGDIKKIQDDKFDSLKISARLCTTAIFSKQKEMYYYLRSAGFKMDADTIAAASFINKADWVKELYYAGCPIDGGVYWNAIGNYNEELVAWVFETKLPHPDRC